MNRGLYIPTVHVTNRDGPIYRPYLAYQNEIKAAKAYLRSRAYSRGGPKKTQPDIVTIQRPTLLIGK